MIAKVIIGKSFGGCVRYLLEREQSAIIDSTGVRDYDIKAIIADLNAQRKMRPQLGNAVGHTVLSWSNEDRNKLSLKKMAAHAREYMEKMGHKNTQYITVLHTDKKHPHLHIVYNRVDNNGDTLDNFNHWHKSQKICRQMTEQYGYHFGEGKKHVNRHSLRGKDKLRYAVHDALKIVMENAITLKQMEMMLKRQGIGMHYKFRTGTNEVQGVSFEKDGVKFKGSAIDRKYSYSGIQKQLQENQKLDRRELLNSVDSRPLAAQIREVLASPKAVSNPVGHLGEIFLDFLSQPIDIVPEPENLTDAEKRRRKRKQNEAKSKGIRR
ncbi:relaxase/mobilization nuclease domain-containing protein [Sphingobacterium oryzagri]|uniref:Relaxase/mobilization nuclease domain-containing protein n=1 Tax=Sphingobacterium oryzagri TaxID=3025669 RepID=A0ABY7WMG8_9SPHI|nr:relaxase/mobilization nuclease domain-containing protein [Sphingobacterium sp. KACC 22765]WDF69598.1 relaxase/mobilization nuclease domain-containing protein [Sphingobacterium sp. KACC 22765]